MSDIFSVYKVSFVCCWRDAIHGGDNIRPSHQGIYDDSSCERWRNNENMANSKNYYYFIIIDEWVGER